MFIKGDFFLILTSAGRATSIALLLYFVGSDITKTSKNSIIDVTVDTFFDYFYRCTDVT